MSRVSTGDAQVLSEIVAACSADITTAIVAGFGCDDVADPAALSSAATPVAITFTSFDVAFTGNAAVTIVDGSAPTVVELLELIREVNAQVILLRTDTAAVRTKLIALLDSLAAGGVLA